MDKTIDLHTHSINSIDGELRPEELVRRSMAAGIRLLSVTDHNSTRGVADAKQEAWKNNIHFVSGIEIESVYHDMTLHILGYGINEKADCFAELEKKILNQERFAGGLRIEMIRKSGIQVDGAYIQNAAIQGVVTGELLAESALRDVRNQDNPLLAPYRPGGVRSDNPYYRFYQDYCAKGKPAYVPIRYESTAWVLDMVHRSGGIGVLAHPGISVSADEENILKELKRIGLDGVEVFTPAHSLKMTGRYYKLAVDLNLLVTCGSDFHGKTKPSVELGGVGFPDGLKLYDDFYRKLAEVRRTFI